MDLTKFGFTTSKKKKIDDHDDEKKEKKKQYETKRERETSRKIRQTSSQVSVMQYHLTMRGT
jgi:hypothetical protein